MTTRILLVEDDPTSRDLLAALLGSQGDEVDTAADGFGALRLAQEHRYDLVFVDYHLPEMDGYALARLMRTLAEKVNPDMKMVAITADRFGLAARRGVDSVFDSMLSKPIEPDALFAFVAGILASPASDAALDDFLAEPSGQDAQSAAQVLWRVRGIGTLPAAAVFPAPNDAERASLEYCFRLVDPAAADCLVLLRRAGLAEVEQVREQGHAFLQPLLTLERADADVADVVFTVGEGDSWSAAAAAFGTFAARRAQLLPGARTAKDVDTRLLGYLHVAGRALVLRRDTFGRTSVAATGGFAPATIVAAVKRLAAQGLVAATPGEALADGARELRVALTAKGTAAVAKPAADALPAAG